MGSFVETDSQDLQSTASHITQNNGIDLPETKSGNQLKRHTFHL